MTGNNNNHVRGNYTLMEISSRMEMPCLSNDFFLELAVVHVHSGLYEHYGRRASGAYNNTFGNQVSAHRECVVFDGPIMW